MSGVRQTGSNPHALKNKKPVDKKPADKKPQQAPAEDDGLFRDEQIDDGWRKKDGPGSSGGYGIRSVPAPPVRKDDSEWDGQLDLFRDTVDIDFSRATKAPQKK